MEFIEMTGRTLRSVLHQDELHPDEMKAVGLTDDSVVRINRQGDIEIRRAAGWDVIGGLLGEFEERICKRTGLDWV